MGDSCLHNGQPHQIHPHRASTAGQLCQRPQPHQHLPSLQIHHHTRTHIWISSVVHRSTRGTVWTSQTHQDAQPSSVRGHKMGHGLLPQFSNQCHATHGLNPSYQVHTGEICTEHGNQAQSDASLITSHPVCHSFLRSWFRTGSRDLVS
jgi:hypothetical protein